MSEPNFDESLGRYATHKTTPEEENLLLRRAAENQEAFDALSQEGLLRELLDDPGSRKLILDATRTHPAWRPRLLWSLALAAATAALVITFLVERPRSGQIFKTGRAGQQTLSAMDSLPADVAKEFEAFRPSDRGATILLEKNTYHAGEGLRLRVQSDVAAKLVLIELAPDGQGRILFPNRWTPSPQVPAATAQSVPPTSEEPIALDAAPGRLHLILAAFPTGSDPDGALQRGDHMPVPLTVAAANIEVQPQ